MCAIFGTAGIANLKLIKEISQKQIFRGPDEQNFYVSDDNLVCLGNNRLSVIDKQNGKQPMFSSNKRFVTVFNGCIYNFLEIKKYLKSKNINFSTNSDTEVVANAYMFFGKKSFNYFDGMWAIAIYDREKKEILLSRDYVGQKPLFYSKNDNYYIFSSQLNGIVLDKNCSTKVSRKNLKKYFTYSFIPAPHTLFENIYQLEPGENILINLQNLNINKKKYWDLKNGADYNTFFNKIPVSQFKQQFEGIIQQHSIADKLPALSLSGGIDSYIVMNYFTKLQENCSSFTLGFENKSFDESKYVKKIKKKLNKQIYYANDKELISSFLKLSKLLSEPIGDSSIIPTYILHNKIKDYSNVTLGGDGGDETFFGYITFDAYYLALKLKKIFPNFFFKIIKKIVGPSKFSSEYITFLTKVRKFFNSIHLNTKYLLASWMGCLSVQDMGNLFNERISEDDIYDDLSNIHSDDLNLMRNAQLYYFKFYLPMVLAKVDQASMFNSVESRSPFLSKKIINFSLDQDVRKLYKFFKKKYFIRKIFSEDVPKEILNRKKHGFAFPKEIILQDKKLIENLLDYNLLTNRDFFKTKYSNFLNKTEDCSQYIWNELILNITLQNLNKSRAF